MKFKSIDNPAIIFFQHLLGERCILDEVTRNEYGKDQTEDLFFLPAIVLKPQTPE